MILSGKALSDSIQDEIRNKIFTLKRKPALAVILVGFHAPSHTYVHVKKRACESVGITSIIRTFAEDISEREILNEIYSLNHDPTIDGILIQSPLPSHLSSKTIIEAVSPEKDVDGFHPLNMGKLLLGHTDGFIPCTPLGIKVLLERSQIEVAGKHVVIVGRSNIVGKPLAALLAQNQQGCNATVTLAHSKTHNLKDLTKSADILIAAVGIPQFITAEMVGESAIVIDVGINRVADASSKQGYRIVGDVAFEEVEKKCTALSPVPKGVGPMTVAMLLQNTLKSNLKTTI